jgi:hypothetical protein
MTEKGSVSPLITPAHELGNSCIRIHNVERAGDQNLRPLSRCSAKMLDGKNTKIGVLAGKKKLGTTYPLRHKYRVAAQTAFFA